MILYFVSITYPYPKRFLTDTLSNSVFWFSFNYFNRVAATPFTESIDWIINWQVLTDKGMKLSSSIILFRWLMLIHIGRRLIRGWSQIYRGFPLGRCEMFVGGNIFSYDGSPHHQNRPVANAPIHQKSSWVPGATGCPKGRYNHGTLWQSVFFPLYCKADHGTRFRLSRRSFPGEYVSAPF